MSVSGPILRYHGGKWKLAPWIISHFPQHTVYVELYGGAASVLMRKPRSYSEVYNDTWGTVVNVFRVLRNPKQAKELERVLRLTPYAREEFDKTLNVLREDSIHIDQVELARCTILRSFAGFGSAAVNHEHDTGFRSNTTRPWTTPAHDWAHYPDRIAGFIERLSGVVIENRPALEVIKRYDTPRTLFYADPPYLHETRNMRNANAAYANEMTTADHAELLVALRNARGMVVISGYKNDLYDSVLGDWTRASLAAMADGARPRFETIWVSPSADNLPLFATSEP